MDGIPLHPAVVHVPLGIALVVPFVAAAVTLATRAGRATRSAWLVVLALQAVVFAGGLAAMNTGEDEEERVEEIVGERRIHDHEERAEAFVWSAAITLALCAAVVALGRMPSRTVALAAVATIAGFVTLGLAYRTGLSGGALVYQHGAASAYAEPAEAPQSP